VDVGDLLVWTDLLEAMEPLKVETAPVEEVLRDEWALDDIRCLIDKADPLLWIEERRRWKPLEIEIEPVEETPRDECVLDDLKGVFGEA